MATAANQHSGPVTCGSPRWASSCIKTSTVFVVSSSAFIFILIFPFTLLCVFFLCFSGIDCNCPIVALDYPFAIILVLTLVIYPFLVADQARRIDLIHLFALLHPCDNFYDLSTVTAETAAEV